MSTCSLTFLVSFLVLSAIFAGLRGRRWRQAILILANAGFIATFSSTLVVTTAFLLGTWGLLALAARKPSGRIVFAGVTGAVLFLIVIKRDDVTGLLPTNQWVSWSGLVGLSYMVFKFIHVLVDVSQGQVPRLSFLTYVNYQLAFFTLTAGPINRYNDFEAAWNNQAASSLGADESFSLWSRIFSGVIKMGIAAPFIGAVIASGAEGVDARTIPPAYLRPLLQFYLFPWQIYFDFAGYTDIVIGCAQLLGFKLPENFNHPFGARNLIDFWNRWHMSLTQWLRVYFFMASYRYVAEHHRKHLRAAGYLLLGVTLIIFGLWHGLSAGYLLFGIVSGIGVVITRMWGEMLNTRLGRAGYHRYLEHRGIQSFAVLATFHFVCFAELFFAVDIGKLAALGKGVLDQAAQPWTGAPTMPLKVALIAVAASVVVLIYSRWTSASGTPQGEHPTRAPIVGTATRAPPAVAWARSYVPMALRASLVALLHIWHAVSQASGPIGFYRTF